MPGCSQWMDLQDMVSQLGKLGRSGWMGPAPKFSAREAFFTPQLLNDFFNWFQQRRFSITDSIPAIGQKNVLRKILGMKEKKKKVVKLNSYHNTVTFVQIFYAELGKKRERETVISPIAQPKSWGRCACTPLLSSPSWSKLVDLLLGLEPAAESSCHPLSLCQPRS